MTHTRSSIDGEMRRIRARSAFGNSRREAAVAYYVSNCVSTIHVFAYFFEVLQCFAPARSTTLP